ncbi:MAG: hypothetical protein LBE03_02720 [Candidatus Nomurabacteria bacterium]|jgi:hypothetical protein|nr:hypothetical protein [Candidatus Nomurabacteria bacterium]
MQDNSIFNKSDKKSKDVPLPRLPKLSHQTLMRGAVVAVIVILGAVVLMQRQKIDSLSNGSPTTEQIKKEADELKVKVAKLMELPDEDATIATVEDAEKLKAQAFFAKAENGDKVLIFTENKKAVVYRPSTNIIINSGPIVISGSESIGGAEVRE